MPWSVRPPTLGSSFDDLDDGGFEGEDGAEVDIEVELPREILERAPTRRPARRDRSLRGRGPAHRRRLY